MGLIYPEAKAGDFDGGIGEREDVCYSEFGGHVCGVVLFFCCCFSCGFPALVGGLELLGEDFVMGVDLPGGDEDETRACDWRKTYSCGLGGPTMMV